MNCTTQNFFLFVAQIRKAKTTQDVYNAWLLLDDAYENIKIIIALPNYKKSIPFKGTDIRDLDGNRIIVPYFTSDSLYFSDRKTITETFKKGAIKIPIDSSIMLDTNIASYINAYVNRQPLKGNQSEIVNLIDQLLDNNPNFDYLYYLVENSKQLSDYAASKPTKDLFWQSIEPGFRDNLISLRQFVSIDNDLYRKTKNDNPTISREEAEEEARNFAYDFYFGKSGSEFHKDIERKLIVAKILLFRMVSIYYQSKEGIRKKASKYLKFLIEELGVYFEREMHIAIKYFKEGKRFTFFEKIDKGTHIDRQSTSDKIENMAWDLMVPRFIETLSSIIGNGKYFIPHYLTWDGGLKEALSIYKAKAVIYDDLKRRVITIPEFDSERELRETVGEELLLKYFSPDVFSVRYDAQAHTMQELRTMLKATEEECLNTLHS